MNPSGEEKAHSAANAASSYFLSAITDRLTSSNALPVVPEVVGAISKDNSIAMNELDVEILCIDVVCSGGETRLESGAVRSSLYTVTTWDILQNGNVYL